MMSNLRDLLFAVLDFVQLCHRLGYEQGSEGLSRC